jgi:hypothetical protein
MLRMRRRRGQRKERCKPDQKFGSISPKSKKKVWWSRDNATISMLRSKHIQLLMVRLVCVSIFRICKRNPHKCSDDATQGVLQVTEGTSVGTWKFDPDLLRSAFAEMIIEDEEPFGFGEKLGFRKFMSIACPRFKIPSRRTCTRDAVQLYFE